MPLIAAVRAAAVSDIIDYNPAPVAGSVVSRRSALEALSSSRIDLHAAGVVLRDVYHCGELGTRHRRASFAALSAGACRPPAAAGALRRIGKPSTARSAALAAGGQPAHPLPPSSRTAAFRGSLRATRAPRSAAVGQPFLVETIFGLRATSRPRARVVFLGGLERSLALLTPSSRRL